MEAISTQMVADHSIKLLHLPMIGDLMRPIAVAEAQKDTQGVSNDGSYLQHGVWVRNIQVICRIHQTIGEHQQGGLVKMRDQKQKKIFVPELFKVCFTIREEALAALSHHREHASGAHEASPGTLLSFSIPVAVVAIAFFKVLQVALGQGEWFWRARVAL